MESNSILTTKEKALIGIGASVASGCRPCTESYVGAARTAGACERGVWLAVETALAVRESATRAMDQWAERCQGTRPPLDEEFRAPRRAIAELIAVAAAAAANSVPDLEARRETARQSGATPEQIRAAIAIGGAVKKTAAEKLAAAAEQAQASEPCCAQAAAEQTGCGCR
jgi:AhpD family alkylhydroperoxidase